MKPRGIHGHAALGGLLVALGLALAVTPARAKGPLPPPVWGALERLVGTWVADSGSGGQPGVTQRGGETWQSDLGGRVMVRRDFSEYPATAAHPAIRHEGMTVITPVYGGGFTARNWDNEGHVIEYAVVASDTAIVFTSAPSRSTPRFRLTYRRVGPGYAVIFEMSAPGEPDAFRPYVTGALHRAP